jgi:anti-sigma B factor antagonist
VGSSSVERREVKRECPFPAGAEAVAVGGRAVARDGELDIASCPQLVATVLQICSMGTSALVLDLSGVTFMGSTGLSAILSARGLCAKHGCEFMLIPGPDQVQRLFELAGVLDRLPFGTGHTSSPHGEPA